MTLSFKERTLKNLCLEDEPWVDMCLPSFFLIVILILLLSGIACTIYAIIKKAVLLIFGAIIICFSIYSIFSWKNRTIHMLSDDTFEFTTPFGRKKLYHFSDITDLKRDRNSHILHVAHDKIFISDMAFISERFEKRVHQALAERRPADM